MDTNALFDVFNDDGGNGSDDSLSEAPLPSVLPISGLDNAVEDAANGIATQSKRKKTKSKNESIEDTEHNPDLASGSDMDDDDGTDVSKRARREKARPDAIVLDSFEEDLQREVKPAGLDTSAADKETGNLVLSHSVRHQVSIPPDYPYVALSQRPKIANPARTYPFELDPFQHASVQCIDSNESVLVAAHTSAGKTVVAEYAIAQCLRNKQRVIYTSPIKALSNQKYREFLEEFGDVGLMTGDVTINPQASCLVMTTEILRSMLYRGSEVMREVAWVVFDEIHYMRDKERGVVWEETIILLPHQVRFVFLSATIPNAMQFAEWITKTHEQPCHVVYTDFRPTPLQHYLFPQGGDGIHLVVDEKSQFREDNFQRAISALQDAQGQAADDVSSGKGGKQRTNKGKQGSGKSDIYKIVKMVMARNYHPVIVFCFSKRECESMALQMSKLDFNTEPGEKDMVGEVFTNAIGSLSEDDRALPQIENILPLLKRGIGIHHSGLLPILKEVIEILFQEGLLKCLFATETFSIGLNMPARTVVFTSVRKFDGKEFRWVMSGEYIQMSGRAGRRGLDDRGVVILMLDEKMEPAIAKGMVKGEPDVLNSAFHLSYNMILNLMRVETFTPQFMLERSFHQFQTQSEIPRLEIQADELSAELDQMKIKDEPSVKRFYDLRTQLDSLASEVSRVVIHPAHSLPFLQPGRLVRVNTGGLDFGWGCVTFFQRKAIKDSAGRNGKRNPRATEEEERRAGADGYIVDVLMHCRRADRKATHKLEATSSSGSTMAVIPCDITDTDDGAETMVVPVLLSCIDRISTVRVHMPKDLAPPKERSEMRKRIAEVGRRLEGRIPLLDPVNDMGIRDATFQELVTKTKTMETKLHEHRLFGSADEGHLFNAYQAKVDVQLKLKDARRRIAEAQSAVQLDELKCRKRVLRRLGYTTAEDVITMKGRVACEITSGDELLLSELMFHGVFNDLTTEQTVALLSCFVFSEKSKDEPPKLQEDLAVPLRVMQESARQIAQISNECKLRVVEEEYVASFRPELMDVVNAWCRGAKFSQICRMTEVFEGSLIRAFRRLEELLRQMCMAAKAIGNVDLENKFADGITKIKRDIIFAASLYL
ncbi:ATP-dependent RNA helicase mtr4 [Coemansia sp. RSA 2671]|nr:ATP-dependent RNA helicase mtr4 [Coemansia sp. RSA 2675]KAJ2349831.1 ATP-dependent RNA helicase mtr4 [Coemansia sp. RSA 2671]